jgi:hypothetical protein
MPSFVSATLNDRGKNLGGIVSASLDNQVFWISKW